MKKSGHLKGRPVMESGKRTKKIDARFTEDEYKIILDMEKTLGIRKTDIVRMRVLENGVTVVFNSKALLGQLDTLGAELGRSGNNINQLARYANILQNRQALSPFVIERFNALFEEYLANQKKIETALRLIVREMRK